MQITTNNTQTSAYDVSKEIIFINMDEKHLKSLMHEVVEALRLCLECEGLTWEAEHEAEIVLSRAKRLFP